MSDHDALPSPAKKTKTDPSSAVSAFFMKASEKPKSSLKWEIRDGSLLIAKYKPAEITVKKEEKTKLAAFDLDQTLIATQSGHSFAKDETDWKFLKRDIPQKLRELNANGVLIVIFTNQAGIKISDSAKRYTQFKSKIATITTQLNVPLLLYAATAHDIYRKPRQGMMAALISDLQVINGGVKPEVDLEQSFFIGDAAGRPAAENKSWKDHGSSDRKFAINADLPFHTPEEYFDSLPAQEYLLDKFDPRTFEQPEKTDHLFERLAKQEIVLFVGSPASGKSTYYREFLEPMGYHRINQDILKTRQKCMVKAKELILEGHSVCIDNTNANIETRAYWLNLGKELNLPVRAIHFSADVKLCEHNNAVRAFCPKEGEEKRELLPGIAFTSYTGRYQEPNLEEGFLSLESVNFVFSGTEEDARNWRQYWL